MACKLRPEFRTSLVVTCAALLLILLASVSAHALGSTGAILGDPTDRESSGERAKAADEGPLEHSLAIDKNLVGATAVGINAGLSFEIVLTNTGSEPLPTVPLTDTYAVGCLEFISSTPATDDQNDDGQLTWGNVLAPGTQLLPGQSANVIVELRVRASCGWTANCAEAMGIGQNGQTASVRACAQAELVGPQLTISKRPLAATACVSETIPFEIVISNIGRTLISELVLTDTYSNTCLDWVNADPLPDYITTIWKDPLSRAEWLDVTRWFGDLEPGRTVTMSVSFHAAASCEALNRVSASGLDANGAPVHAEAETPWPVLIDAPTSCQGQLANNGGFELGSLSGWRSGSTPAFPPAHVEVVAPGRASTRSLFIGNGFGESSAIGTAWIAQDLFIPEDVAGALLSFWYRTDSAGSAMSDKFWVSINAASTHLTPLSSGGASGWTPFEYDLSAYRGMIVRITFGVSQDGQPSPFGAYLDDVQLCLLACEPRTWASPSPPPDSCMPLALLQRPDYAPAGMPDFDQRQAGWQAHERWPMDPAVAAADALWWLDSRYEVSASPPPARVDHYPLVEPHRQTWDDHDTRNVVPLVDELSTFIGAGPAGASPELLQIGLSEYVASKSLSDDLVVARREWPSADWLRDSIGRGAAIILQIGFWELGDEGLGLLGSHYVSVAQIGCNDDWIAISDPFLDHAEAAHPGYVRPWQLHPHPAAPPDAVHNDAAVVSHDQYRLSLLGDHWQLQGYPMDEAILANFYRLHTPPGLQELQSEEWRGGPAFALAQSAIAIMPRLDPPLIRASPSSSHALVDQVWALDLMVEPGARAVDEARVYLDFDPALLMIVDENSQPAEQLIPGERMTQVQRNRVDHNVGQIDFVARSSSGALSEPFILARIRLRALAVPPGGATSLQFSWGEPRHSDLLRSEQSIGPGGVEGSVLVGPATTLSGHVRLEGRPPVPDPAYAGSVLVQLYVPETATAVSSLVGQLDEMGDFRVANLIPGWFDVSVKGMHTLAHRQVGAHLVPGDAALEWGPLTEGDVNGDNVTNMLDASLMSASYGAAADEPGYSPKADLNQDGNVDMSDVQLLTANLGLAGDVIEASGEPQSKGSHSSIPMLQNSLGGIAIALMPEQLSRPPGDIVSLALTVEAGSHAVDGVAAYLHYDPDALTLVDALGHPTEQIAPEDVLPHVYLNQVDRNAGIIRFAAGALGDPPPQGTFIIARIRLRINASTSGDTWLHFGLDPIQGTMAAHRGEPILSQLRPCRITVSGVPTPTPTRTPTRQHTATATPTVTRRPTLTPTATPAPCTQVLSDDFEDGGLAGWTPNLGVWTNPGNVMRGISISGSAWNMLDVNGQDLIYEGTLTLRSGEAMGLTFRSSADGSESYDLIMDAADGMVRLGKRTPYVVMASAEFNVEYHHPYRIKVLTRGDTLEAYVDGVKLLAAAGATPTGHGSLGVIVIHATADFDDLRACRMQPLLRLELPLIFRG